MDWCTELTARFLGCHWVVMAHMSPRHKDTASRLVRTALCPSPPVLLVCVCRLIHLLFAHNAHLAVLPVLCLVLI